MQIWARLAEIFKTWYDEIQDVCDRSRVLHGDETGWRVDGKLEWLRRLTTRNETYYFIVDSRGSDVIKRFFNNDWTGVLVSDFWNAYNHVEGDKDVWFIYYANSKELRITKAPTTIGRLLNKPLKLSFKTRSN